MTLAEQYARQARWRRWDRVLPMLPLAPKQKVLDLGCGVGSAARLLAERGAKVTGVDADAELLALAREEGGAPSYVLGDLTRLEALDLPAADGIWSSFVVAYFPDLVPLLRKWSRFLKPGGWICLVETDDLFGHEPLSAETRALFERFYEEALAAGRYDFRAGGKLAGALEAAGYVLLGTERIPDVELAFDGPAQPDVLLGWEERLDRMPALRRFLGAERFATVRAELLACLASPEHRSRAQVVACVARKGGG